jgi:ATP-dependent helicase/nuclease subunit B
MSVLLYNEHYALSDEPKNYNEFIAHSIKNEKRAIAIVPTSKLIKRLKIKYIQSSEIPVPDINIFNIEKFVKSLFTEFFNKADYEFISDAYKRLLFEEAANNIDFVLYASNNKKIGKPILEKLEKIITGMKEKGIMPEDMDSTKGELYDNNRFTDINQLYKKYQELLGNNLLDYSEIIIRLIEFFQKPSNYNKINDYFSNFEFILLSGFSQFTVPEARLFGLISSFKIPFALNVDLDEDNAPVFGNLHEIIAEINTFSYNTLNVIQLYDDNVIDKIPNNYDDAPASIALRKWLFHTEVNINNKNLKNVLKIYKADDVEDEVTSITKLVKYLMQEEKYKPYEICITSRQPEKYSNLFRMNFASAGIPANISDRFSLDSSVVITAVIDALNLINKGFKTADLFRFIQNPMVSISDELDVNNLMKVTGELRFYGGKSKRGLKGLKNAVTGTLEYLKKIYKKSSDDAIEEHNLKIKIQSYEQALKDVEIIFEKFNFDIDYNEVKIIDFQSFIIENIIDRFEIKKNIIEFLNSIKNYHNKDEHLYYTKVEELEKNSRALNKFLNVMSELVFIHSVRHPDETYSSQELTEMLITAVQATKYNISEKMDYGVEITSIEQTRGIPYKVMILCGAVDGSFPIPYQTDTYLGKELAESEDKHQREEQIQFYQFLTNNTELLDSGQQKIFIFYPSFDNEKELIRSHFIDSLLRVASSDEDMDDIITGLDDIRNQNNYTHHPWVNSITTIDEFYFRYNEIESSTFLHLTEPIKQLKSDSEKVKESLNNELKLDFGLLEEKQIKMLEKYKNKTYSISELETYATCPYKYFVQRVLRFQEKEDYESGLSALESGSALHNILYKFYTELHTHPDKCEIMNFGNLQGIKLIPENKEFYRKLLKETAEEEFNSKNFSTVAFEADKYNILKENGILEVWLDFEIAQQNDSENEGFYATFFEKGFENMPLPDFDTGEMKYRGKIDRIDLKKENEQILYRVIDYKLTENSVKSDKDIEKLESFQMPVYIKATENLLSSVSSEANYDAGIYYPVILKKDAKLKKVLDKEGSDFLIDEALAKSGRIRNDIAHGIFSVEPKKDVCKYCNYQAVCKIGEKNI